MKKDELKNLNDQKDFNNQSLSFFDQKDSQENDTLFNNGQTMENDYTRFQPGGMEQTQFQSSGMEQFQTSNEIGNSVEGLDIQQGSDIFGNNMQGQDLQQNNFSNTPVGTSNNYGTNIPEAKKKKDKAPIIFLSIIGVIFLLLVGGVVAFSQASIRNKIYLAVLSPEKYYIRTELRNLENNAELISDWYDISLDSYANAKDKSLAKDMELKVDLASEISSLIGASDVFPMTIKMNTTLDMKNKAEKVNAGLVFGKENIADANIIMDMREGEIGNTYIQLPEFHKGYLYMKAEDMKGSVEDKESYEYSKAYSKYLSDPSSAKFIVELIMRYGKLMIEGPWEIDLEKNVAYTVADSSANMTKIKVEITEKSMMEWLNRFSETIQKDSNLKKECMRLELCTEADYDKFLKKLVDAFEDTTVEASSSEKIIMEVMVDKNGDIQGREFYAVKDNKVLGGCYYAINKVNGEIRFEVAAYENSREKAEVILNGTAKKEKDGYRGKAEVKDKNDKYGVTVEFDKVGVADKKSNTYNGEFTLTTKLADVKVPALFGGMKLKFILKGEKDKQNAKLSFDMSGKTMFSIEVNDTTKEGEAVICPKDEKLYNINDLEEMQQFTEDMDQEAIKRFTEKIGKYQSLLENIPGLDKAILGNGGLTDSDYSEEDELSDEGVTEDVQDDQSKDNSDDTPSVQGQSSKKPSTGEEPYVLTEVPKSVDEIPAFANLKDDFYSYDVSDKAVKEYGKPSSALEVYDVTIEDVEAEMDKEIKKASKLTWKKNTESRNNVYGGVYEDNITLSTRFETICEWTTDEEYNSVSIVYDTYSHKVNSINLYGKDRKALEKILKKFITISTTNPDKVWQQYEKLTKKKENYASGNTNGSYISYSYSSDTYSVNLSAIDY